MQRLLFILYLLLTSFKPFAQQCRVMSDSLQGFYSGNCKNGMANGKGTAKGIDTYIGHFKDGYPDGTGKYTWKNGSWYNGNWKKGVYNGKGTLHLIGPDKTDREYIGLWHEGSYLGSESKPYVINSMSGKVSEVSIHKGNGSAMGDITITVYDMLNGAGTLDAPNAGIHGSFIPKQKLTDIQVLSGSIVKTVSDEYSSNFNNIYRLFGVGYPLRVILTFQGEQVDLEILEKGKWDIFVKLEIMKSETTQ